MRRVVITGIGAVTPLGNDTETLWNNLKAGKVAFDRITRFDSTQVATTLVAEVKDFNPTVVIEKRSIKRLDLFSQYALVAAAEALQQAGLSEEARQQMGCIIGSGFGGVQSIDNSYQRHIASGVWKTNPLFMPMMLSNMAAGNVAIYNGLKGKTMGLATACATGTNAIGEAFRAIKYGEVDGMVAGGTEAPLQPFILSGFEGLKAMSEATDPYRCSIPFDEARDGFVIGEGAGVLVLEELTHAQARGANILAEIVGYGASCDAYHITLPDQEGAGAAQAMIQAIDEAGIQKEAISYINAHGTSTKQNDICETKALKAVFGVHASHLKVNSTKSMIGHLLGAAGAVEAIVCIKTLLNNYIHHTAGYRNSEAGLDLNYVADEGIYEEVTYALSNSLGFGGHNASVLLKKYIG